MEPKVSVVIPLYNKEPHVERALDSVFAQTEGAFEVIVVDDASTDRGPEVVRARTDPRLRMISRGAPGPGGHAARNAGIAAAKAPLIAFLDADDAWEPRYLETVLRLRENFPEAGAYVTAYRMTDWGGRVELKEYSGIPPAPWEGLVPDFFASSSVSQVVWMGVTAVPKTVFAAVGNFPEGVPKGGDLEMWLRIALKYPIAMSRYVGGTWHRDSVNRICDTVETVEQAPVLALARRALADPALEPALKEKVRGYHDAMISMFAKECLLEGRRAAARRILDGAFGSRDAFLYRLTYLPTPLFAALVALRRKALGLS